MLKLSVGYQFSEENSFFDAVSPYLEAIEEIYFPWTDTPSGRSMIGGYDGYFDYSLQQKLTSDLRSFKDAGKRLDLLFNANCYGAQSQSRAFFHKIGTTMEYVAGHYGLRSVTTTSPLTIWSSPTGFAGSVSMNAPCTAKAGPAPRVWVR